MSIFYEPNRLVSRSFKSFRFGHSEIMGDEFLQDLYITDIGEQIHHLRYSLVRFGSMWKISGVEFVRARTYEI